MPSRTQSAAIRRPSPGTVSSRPTRLTRRGRAVVLFIALVALLGVFSLGRVSSQAAVTPRGLRQVVVTPGETLWSLALRAEPAADPRETVESLMALNHLRTAQIAAGELLLLPPRAS